MSKNLKVLFVEDDAAVRLGGMQALRLNGLEVQSFERAEHALRYIEFGFPGILVSDIRLPGMSGLALLEHTVGTDASLPVILVTGHGDIPMAVDAMRRGAYDFVEKPYSSEQLVDVSQRALEKRRLTLELASVRQALAHQDNIEARILGRSPAIERLRRMILELADADANALILGETGTGKELVARSLHDYGHRKAKNFAAINCAGIPELLFESEVFGHEAGSFTGAIKRRIGKIEYARGGTLFLDEIETMQMSLQVKLLRLLQEKKFERVGSNDLLEMDCRIVAGSKADLLALSSTNHFRDDLYYRLGVMVLEIPPLRERREDIPFLFEHFVVRAAAEYNRPIPDISPAQMHDLMSRPWGGNVRELRNVAERFTLGMPTRVDAASSDDNTEKPSLETKLNLFERQLIEEALRGCSGRTAIACERLGVPKKTLYDKIRRLGISTEEFK
ncbi:two-component system C4-dicarboxylate transport response regulator DctD [Caballeronia udeis]|uniref:Two-component system C4-dicarboxylate transport response regulator DctD n=1 Tax=Caballeronia udeis TaxID=1232866 RepID=A0ABW8MHN4_9BURK